MESQVDDQPGRGGFARAAVALLVLVVAGVTLIGLWPRLFAPAEIEQPIAFSHRLHAGEKKIPCQYCHAYARRSTVAGVPSVQTCMGCHALVAVRKPEIRKVAAYWEQRAPIPWVKIHNLPDFVYFSHKRHIRAGLACQQCHGPVETMDRVYQYSSLEMGWCLTCHTERGAPIDCVTCHK